MKLSDLIAGLNMSVFPSIGLIAFGLVFLAVTIRVVFSPPSEAEHQAALPLEDETPNVSNPAREPHHV